MPIKPSRNEEEYIARLEYEKRRKLQHEQQMKMEQEERQKIKELHFMKCPKCGMQLIEVEYKNIKVDKCSECDGVWLDAGEMEQIVRMEKSILDKFWNVFGK